MNAKFVYLNSTNNFRKFFLLLKVVLSNQARSLKCHSCSAYNRECQNEVTCGENDLCSVRFCFNFSISIRFFSYIRFHCIYLNIYS